MTMRIVTINVPDSYLAAFKSLTDAGLYNSRSELVRVCLTNFLDKEKRFVQDLKEEKIKKIQYRTK
ncbi:MAG: ribbon-helix-helix domain-containing protein [Promethearchaeota archaeon]